MALPPPDVKILCRLTAAGLTAASSIFDDLDWWRRNLLAGDTDPGAIVDRIPDDVLTPSDREGLRLDLRALSPLVAEAMLDALVLAVRRAQTIEVTYHLVPDPGGDLIVTTKGSHMIIDVGIFCVSR